jgi:hypothetical protein
MFRFRKEVAMAWIALFVAGLFEVGWAIGLKYTDRPAPSFVSRRWTPRATAFNTRHATARRRARG